MNLNPLQPIHTIDLFPEILDHLLKLLADLSADEWETPTVCTGWSVKDVALHLLGVDISNLSRRRDGHAPGGKIDDWATLVAFINKWNAAWVEAARRISPPLLIDLLRFTGVQMADYFRSLDLNVAGPPVNWAGDEPAPVWLDVAREYTERWHHQQHIRDAVGRPGLKEPRYLALVLAAFVRALPAAFQAVDAVEGTVVTLTISGGSGGQWSLVQEESTWRLYEGATDQPTAEVGVEEDIAWRLFTRGLDPNQAQVTISGNPALGARVLAMVSIIA
jgi:uncharacterized protein (TIGR03083 family)